MNILVVEENPTSSLAIAETLESLGHKTQQVSSGAEALVKLGRSDYQVILLDISLPDIPGDQLIPQFRKIKPETGIITMTDHNSRELEKKIRNLGILYYMIKPVHTKVIRDLLNYISCQKDK